MGKVVDPAFCGEIKTKIYKDLNDDGLWKVFYTWDNKMYWGGFKTHELAMAWTCRMLQDRMEMLGR